MMTKVDSVEQGWIFTFEFVLGTALGGGEYVSRSDFIKPARIALVAPDEILWSDLEPAGHPNINGIVLSEWALCEQERGRREKRNGHDTHNTS